jgi:hypothetical protein
MPGTKTRSVAKLVIRIAVAASMLPLSSCSSDDSGSGSSGTEFQCPNTTAEAPLACCELINAIIEACVRCNMGTEHACSVQANKSVMTASHNQGCGGADQIRDSQSLYDECLPALQSISCSDLSNGQTPASCTDQIQYYM